MSHRNVLLLIADDWSPIAGCYGNNVIKMPSVDALAARGTLFKHAFCTTPSCAASRANLLTGHYSHTHGQYGHSHSIHNFHTQLDMPSIPKTLQSAGFTTGVVGKLHVQPESVYPWNYEAGGGRNVRSIADNVSKFFETIGAVTLCISIARVLPPTVVTDTHGAAVVTNHTASVLVAVHILIVACRH